MILDEVDVAVPTRRQIVPKKWALKGELFLNCSCETFCPCVVSLGKARPTEGYCHAWMAIRIDEGHFEGEDIGGLNVALLADIPGRMAEGNWSVAAYVDERATPVAYDGLLQIFSGAAGGTTGLFTMLVSNIFHAEQTKVDIETDGSKRRLNVGKKIQGEIETIGGLDPEKAVVITNSQYWMGPDIIAAQGTRSRVRDHGRMWDFGGKSAEICPIDWSGA
jgi:hypothetical protein